jgi:hypothetical protein
LTAKLTSAPSNFNSCSFCWFASEGRHIVCAIGTVKENVQMLEISTGAAGFTFPRRRSLIEDASIGDRWSAMHFSQSLECQQVRDEIEDSVIP